MALRVIGAGLPRTGTTSLKAALEALTGEPCYHMSEFYPRAEEHGRLFWRALDGDIACLDEALAGYGSAVDWPSSLFWRELADRHPEALGLDRPDEPFPHLNDTASFRAQAGPAVTTTSNTISRRQSKVTP